MGGDTQPPHTAACRSCRWWTRMPRGGFRSTTSCERYTALVIG